MGQQDDGKIGQSKVEGCVPVVNAQGQAVFFGSQSLHLKDPCCDILQEQPRSATCATLAEQIVNLGGDRCRDNQGARLGIKNVPNERLAYIAAIG